MFVKSSLHEFVVCVFIQTLDQELQEVKLQLTAEQEKVADLENKFKQLEVRGYTDVTCAKMLCTTLLAGYPGPCLNHQTVQGCLNHGIGSGFTRGNETGCCRQHNNIYVQVYVPRIDK